MKSASCRCVTVFPSRDQPAERDEHGEAQMREPGRQQRLFEESLPGMGRAPQHEAQAVVRPFQRTFGKEVFIDRHGVTLSGGPGGRRPLLPQPTHQYDGKRHETRSR